ncbi:putative flippase GtrA [Krasilnikovia cinnamomea]|uniref:Putative flippase GtrA n=1 Tax=Krasilnikovia cinnamomea TaxID=349313 RepID=A0A4V2G7H1_9ACTN|nr:GtrA family protein [Krasilnikovia cinnamomea]RZU52566.1 putative flippase GtrA [Krasilnikovia cinnamomea]
MTASVTVRSVIVRVASDQRMRYLAAGGAGALLYYVLFSTAWLLTGRTVPYLVIAVAVSTICAVVTYPVYRLLVFRAADPLLSGFLRFYLLCLGSLGYTVIGLSSLVELAGLHVLLAQAIVVVTGPVINYQLSRLWAFRTRAGR